MANFKKAGSLMADGAPIFKSMIIGNSVVAPVLNSYKLSSGFLALGTTGALVFGHADSIVTDNGVGQLTTGVAGAAIDSYVGTFTVTSDNQTVAKTRGVCDVSKYTLYSAPENATIGTTTGSNLAGYTQDLSDSTVLSESSAVATTGQYMGWGTDPLDSTRAIVNIYESQVFGV